MPEGKKSKTKPEKQKNLSSSKGLIMRQQKEERLPHALSKAQDNAVVLSKKSLFPVIGIGASAGGLEAFEQFFRNMPPENGMTFVLVPHLDPSHASILTDILQRVTVMPVIEAEDQIMLKPNHVYVIPPNRDMSIFQGALYLNVPEAPRGQRMPIDFFLRSLAEEQGENSIGVILSGTGTDGTLGLRSILGAGGVSFLQEPSSAKYDGMPVSAIQSGLATYILPVEKMPDKLMSYVKTIMGTKAKPAPTAPVETTSSINKIMMIIRSKTGHDFSLYKQSTIKRRIERRMTVHNIDDKAVYARYLHEHPDEVNSLFRELLINVTSFFRDPEAFAILENDILPKLFENKPEDYTFRVWSPGCATGEEPYSIAMILREYMDEVKQEFKVQIYATDIDDQAIAEARSGLYPSNIGIDITKERLRRFFIKEETGYRIKKEIREMVIFATQNVIKDPPFTKLDLLSCRNLLIYLEPELQNRLIQLFHYSLKPGGILFLSPSEGIGNYHELFAPISKKWRFYEVKSNFSSTRAVMTGALPLTVGQTGKAPVEAVKMMKDMNIPELTGKTLLQYYAPASVVTDEKGTILYVHGDTGRYLRPAPGHASLNVIEMAREGLQMKLRTAIYNLSTQKKEMVFKDLQVKSNGGYIRVNLAIRPFTDPVVTQSLLLICFQEPEPQITEKIVRSKKPIVSAQSKRIQDLEHDLMYTKENLQATIEEMQAVNEELKSTNEELQSTNEELQSTNEELETSKEELQSVNEELMTVNAELQAKIEQMARMQNDMKNFLDNINIGIIFLDARLTIKRFTRESAAIFRLVSSDIGRSLSDIKSNLVDDDLIGDAQAVIDSLIPREKEGATTDNTWLLIRILPYRTLENMIEGVVITFTDITELKKAEEEIQKAREFAENIVDTVREPLIVLDNALKVVSASRSFYRIFHVSPSETIGQRLYDLGNHQWDIPSLRELLKSILSSNKSFDDYEVCHDFPDIGIKKIVLNARRIIGKTDEMQFILLAMEVVTDSIK